MPVFDTDIMALAAIAVAAYLLGSVAFGLVFTRFFGLGDIRKIGSGNIGATNVLRTGSKSAAALTLVFDGAKGAAAVLLARAIAGEDAAQIAGISAFLGHLFPVWLGFKGGKGVATFIGVVLALAWPVGIAVCVTWLLVAALFRMSSLAALVASAGSVLFAILFGHQSAVVLLILLVGLVVLRHRENIDRIRAGTESRIGQKG